MSNEQSPELHELLNKVREFAIQPPEKTLFDVGARGYWENPTSDLLAFFMNPHAEHGLGGWFLEAYLHCADHRDCSIQGATVEREYPTKLGRIDLLIEGGDWVLVIENKIHAGINNPLDDYKSHAEGKEKKAILTILSLQQEDEQGWKSITYQEYLIELERQKPVSGITKLPAKWFSFANEFILHLKNLIPTSISMTKEQFQFTESNLVAISEAKILESVYREQLISKVSQMLMEQDPRSEWSSSDAGWALKWKGPMDVELTLQTPDRIEVNPLGKFSVGAWITGFADTQVKELAADLGSNFPISLYRGVYEWESQVNSSDEAIAKLRTFVAAVKVTREKFSQAA
jgi:hypothetical protein